MCARLADVAMSDAHVRYQSSYVMISPGETGEGKLRCTIRASCNCDRNRSLFLRMTACMPLPPRSVCHGAVQLGPAHPRHQHGNLSGRRVRTSLIDTADQQNWRLQDEYNKVAPHLYRNGIISLTKSMPGLSSCCRPGRARPRSCKGSSSS